VFNRGLVNVGSARAARSGIFYSLLCVLLAAPALPDEVQIQAADVIAASRRLHQRGAAALAPLPDTGSGITRDVGSIAIIEHDGSNYDATEPDGTANFAPRTAVAQRFYQTHGDFYDFLVIFTNFKFKTDLYGHGAIAFHNGVRASDRGNGHAVYDNGQFFGSPGRLLGYIDMADIARYTTEPMQARPGVPLSATPGDLGFRDTLSVMAHEVAHEWLVHPRFKAPDGQISSDLIGLDGAHWSYLFDSDGSVMEGAEWVKNPDGSYTAARTRDTYSSLDLYLMGLLDPAKVAPFTLLRNPAINPAQSAPAEGTVITGTPQTVKVDDIIAAEGPRDPDFRTSLKNFRVGVIFLTAPGVEPAPDDLAAVERLRQAFAGHFFALTRGVAIGDTTLAEAPPQSHAGSPDLTKALAWLLSRQTADGNWQDSSFTSLRDTTAALEALIAANEPGAPYQAGRQWLLDAQPPNLDYAARRAITLALAAAPGLNPQQLAQTLLSRQNRDGGFGISAGYESDPLDTALALRALAALHQPLSAPVRRALTALAGMRTVDGGWPGTRGGEASTVATAEVLLALHEWLAAAEAAPLIAPGLAALLEHRNADGGFGQSPSTPYATALALQALLGSGAAQTITDAAIAWLQGAQLEDGSWEDSSYETALVLATLKGGLTANLVVPGDTLVLDPASPREGDTVHVRARVRNVGKALAAPSHARLYDGSPSSNPAVAEAAVPSLAPGEDAEVTFDFETTDHAGNRTLFVVADAAGEVSESREDDNATSRALHVEGLLADLTIATGDLTVNPYPPQEGETVQLAVTIRSVGARGAAASSLGVFDGNPRLGGSLIAQLDVPALDRGQSTVVTLPWTAGALGRHTLFAVADFRYAVYESDELNNETSLPVDVTGPLAPGPDLNVALVALSPDTIATLPQTGQARVVLRNLGRDEAVSEVALYDRSTSSAPLIRQPVQVGPRTQLTLTLPYTVTSGGTRLLFVVADPDGTLPESNEDNNQGSASLLDLGNTLDLEILPADVATSSDDLVVGELLTVTVVVHNRGTTAVRDVPVILAHAEGATLAELARRPVSLDPGASTTLTLSWTTSILGNPLALAVQLDPFHILNELNEANNRVDIPVRVRPSALPNLAVSGADVTFQPDPPLEGAAATVSAVVRNTNIVPAGPFVLRFYRGDPGNGGTVIGEAALPGLDASSSATAAITWDPVDARGQQGVFVVADAAGQVEEYDETDNQAFRPFSIVGLPDLVLTTAALSLDPGFPRSGEAVTLRAVVRNLGSQPSAVSLLRAFEGEADSGRVIGEVPIPALAPKQTLSLEIPWTPSSPPGEKTLTVVADAEDAVREQDEGNNRARRSVVVQDAELYLTQLYFSPDGDGVQDDTTLGYRATTPVTIVVSDSRGNKRRTLAEDAPAEGSITWDGRADDGRLMWDGAYTFTLIGSGGVVLGRATTILDTNRSTLHDAAGTDLTAISNLTCKLPTSVSRPMWMPGEDEVLVINYEQRPGFDIGLIRASLGGDVEYVVRDPSIAEMYFASDEPVSPDGREVLLVHGADGVIALDLVTGTTRVLGWNAYGGRWSPDGRAIVTSGAVLDRDGVVLAGIPYANRWIWSPSGRELASAMVEDDDGNGPKVILRFVRRDGSEERSVTVGDVGGSNGPCINAFEWRSDGVVSVIEGIDFGSPGRPNRGPAPRDRSFGCNAKDAYLVDPETLTSTTVAWLPAQMAADTGATWSPDGGKVLYQSDAGGGTTAKVALADGSLRLPLIKEWLQVAPHATAAFYTAYACASRPSFNYDTYAIRTLQNLTAELFLTRLPANNGILMRGTVADQALDHFQIEYATQADPDVWHPVGPAVDVDVLDDVFGVFLPPAPGTFLVRLTAVDRAGNSRSRVKVIRWDSAPALTNLSQSEFLISPNGDGIRETVRFDYLVQIPTRVDVRITGPGKDGPTVRRFNFDYPTIGPGFFVWDGRDDGGQVVPDGRYAVLINDLPFRVDVDATPPDIAWSYQDLRIEKIKVFEGDKEVGEKILIAADRFWHVVDPRLQSWSAPLGLRGKENVFVPEVDENGDVIIVGGKPRIKLVDGRPADRKEREEEFRLLELPDMDLQLFASADSAGNKAELVVPAVDEKLFLVQCINQATGLPTFRGPLGTDPLVIVPKFGYFDLRETVRHNGKVRFQYQAASDAGGPWKELPIAVDSIRGRAIFPTMPLVPLGQAGEVRGRFIIQNQAGAPFTSDSFRFRFCDASLALGVVQYPPPEVGPIPGTNLSAYSLSVEGAAEPLTNVRVYITGTKGLADFSTSADLDVVSADPDNLLYQKTLTLPWVACRRRPFAQLLFHAVATGQSGRVYTTSRPCIVLDEIAPGCGADLEIRQKFLSCEQSSPDRVLLAISGSTNFPDSVVTIERGPVDAPVVIDSFPAGGLINKRLLADVTGVAEGELPVRGRIEAGGSGVVAAAVPVPKPVFVDRTPPVAEVVVPAEGGEACVGTDERVRLVVDVDDHGPVTLTAAEVQFLDDPANSEPRKMELLCRDGCADPEIENAPQSLIALAPGEAVFDWLVQELPAGHYAVRLTLCDRSGFTTTVVRHLSFFRNPPYLAVSGIARKLFSPNGDGKSDNTIVTVFTDQALTLWADVVDPTTRALVRKLVVAQTQPAGSYDFVWDGKDDRGQTAPDGIYDVMVRGVNACGLEGKTQARVEVDNTPPTGVIYLPTESATVGVSTDLRGAATDLHFKSYVLSFGVGPDPVEWHSFADGINAVSGTADLPGLLGRWDASSTEGVYTLRLETKDNAENEAQFRRTVRVGPRTYLDSLRVEPVVFSPNGDGRLEETTIRYRLLLDARVVLDVRNASGTIVRRLVQAVESAGDHGVDWDGLSDTGTPVPEGELEAHVKAADPASGTPSQQEGVALVLDVTPPRITIAFPVAGRCVTRQGSVHGSIEDRRVASYSVTATSATGGLALELESGVQGQNDADLAQLNVLGEGAYTLSVLAEDAAQNRSQQDIPVLLDSIAPVVRLQSPLAGAMLLRGSEPIVVKGSAKDTNLQEVVLSFGPGNDPGYFVDITRGTTGGDAIPLGAWTVAALPDGLYTLRLQATDCAGQTSETRITVTLDGTPPTAEIALPVEAGYLRAGQAVTGTATDENFESWKLESAPGAAAPAGAAWSPLASGTAAVNNSVLASSFPLPPDGVHTFRLTAKDRAGLTAEARRTVTVDTTPPAAPTGLAAEVLKNGGPTADVQLTWDANTEPDLAGYQVSRDDALLTADPIVPHAYLDTARPEGRYRYSVVAVDKAGNVSPPAFITVRIDLTPPLVDISSPRAGATVSGSVDVRGTAYSVDDFKEYRLFVGAGTSPTVWTLLKRSTVPVQASLLGTWTATTAGPYVLALEAEDTSGNQARTTVPVTVDVDAPEPPVLTSVTNVPEATSLTETWEPSPSTDVTGYLVYRNGRIANAPGLVVGDVKAFLVPAPTYVDPSLPDGRHCYRVVAADAAGNLSAPSNEICQALDNRAPQAVIVAPGDGARFEFPVRVVAFTPDRDVASVQFQFKPHDEAAWAALGAALPAEPFETTLDPQALSLVFGAYDLRAVATDQGGRTDPAPAAITVVYGDTTPPPIPLDLVAHVDGNQVQLTWRPVVAPDLVGYHVNRDGTRLTAAPIPDPAYGDGGVEQGRHVYEVVAVDHDGNESAPASTEAVVYAVRLDFVYPVTTETALSMTGHGARESTTLQILAGDTAVASAPATAEAFRVENVPLAHGPNTLHALGVDAHDNRSIPSDELLLIADTPPDAVTGLGAIVTDHDVALSWDPVSGADVYGYTVRRDGVPLTATSPVTEVQDIFASSSYFGTTPQAAFDGNPYTVWIPTGYLLPADWTVTFPAPVLVDRVGIRFGGLFGQDAVIPDYQVQAQWQGRFIPLAFVRGNTQTVVEHLWPTAFATDALRIVVESAPYDGIGEVTISKRDVIPAGTTSFADPGLADGVHTYAVNAIDRYGVEGAAGTASAPIGDVTPPSAPIGLTATPVLHDVLLSWNANPEPDVVGYVLLRDGVRIATVAGTFHRDVGLANGLYHYTVRAVDSAGLESPESAPAQATVAVPPEPPGAPIIMFPTDAAHPITLAAVHSDVRGVAQPGAIVSLDVNGSFTDITVATPGTPALFETGSAPMVSDAFAAEVSADGTRLAFSAEDAAGAVHTTLLDSATGATRELTHAGYEEVSVGGFSPDGGKLSYVAGTFSDPAAPRDALFVVDLATDVRTVVEDGPDTEEADPAWAPDGHRLAFFSESATEAHLSLRDLDQATTRLLVAVPLPQTLNFARWSPDGTRLAYLLGTTDGGPYELRILDLAAGSEATVATQVWPAASSWSPDGGRLSYTLDAPRRVVIQELANGSVSEVTDGSVETFNSRFDATGSHLSFVRVAPDDQGTPLARFAVDDLRSGEQSDVAVLFAADDVNATLLHEWVSGGRLVLSLGDHVGFFEGDSGAFEFKNVALSAGPNELVARATDLQSGLTGPDSRPVQVTVSGDGVPDLAVAAEDLLVYPTVPLVGQPAMLSAQFHNLGVAAAGPSAVVLSLIDGSGVTLLEHREILGALEPGQSVVVSAAWTFAAPGTYLVRAQIDPDRLLEEADEHNNDASSTVFVSLSGDVVADLQADRAAYAARSDALLQVSLTNSGSDFEGTVETSVEDASGSRVASLDARQVALSYGGRLDFPLLWNTGGTYAGPYAFHTRVTDAGGLLRAEASRAFTILPDVSIAARLRALRTVVPEGEPAAFAARVENRGANVPLEGSSARLRIVPEGGGAPLFESSTALPLLLPGGLWESALSWPSATPQGRYSAELAVLRSDGTLLAGAAAAFEVTSASTVLVGSLQLQPADILTGQDSQAQLTVANHGTTALMGLAITVEMTGGADPSVLLRETVSLDLAPGETREATVPLATAAFGVGSYPVFLRVVQPAVTLDRALLRIHGFITPPSIDSPADGSTVSTSHPSLCVNNATSTAGAPLRYEFQVFADAALQAPVGAVSGIAEGAGRTCWRVPVSLAENATSYWRARAGDGFSTSAYTPVARFRVDEKNEPPSAPVPQTPLPGARVTTNTPLLVVTNAEDQDFDRLTYEFRLASDPGMTQIVASASGLEEGSVNTSWPVPIALEEDATYYWAARANDGRADSPWSQTVSFIVDTTNASPTAPTPLRPIGGVTVATLAPELAVGNATDAEHDPLTYVFQIDRVASFDSPALQVSPAIAEGAAETTWTPPLPLADNTAYFWRAAATDGHSQGPWAGATFFVSLGNDPPSAPVLIDPADGQVVATATPALRLRDAVDLDHDALTYEFEVKDSSDQVVASTSGVPETPVETTWVVPTPLAENQTYSWRARAFDGTVNGPWSDPARFRVNAVAEPPTAPTIVSPAEGDVVHVRQVTLVAGNATSPDGLTLSYAFELYAVAPDNSLTLVEQVQGIGEGSGTTSWSPATPLADGGYAWRVRASDGQQNGPWSATAHFQVAVDVPPAPPTGLAAIPGDQQVALSWNPSPEPDVVRYHVYRATTAGGPYTQVGTTTTPAFTDTGLTNGVTVYYVVTALDAQFESDHSAEVAATPVAPPLVLSGTLAVVPADVLAGGDASAIATIKNEGGSAVAGVSVVVEVASTNVSQSFAVDLAAGESKQLTAALAVGSLPAGTYTVLLKAGPTSQVLATALLRIHSPLSAPSIDSPADGSRVASARPTLVVNDVAHPDGVAVGYEFQLYADAALTELLATATVAEQPNKTGWTVPSDLTEDQIYYWRARASDGFSLSPWSVVASFMVDQFNAAPTAPVPDSPTNGARVATNRPTLVVANATDPEHDTLTYEFRIATDADFVQIVATATGIHEGVGLTSWPLPVSLQENGVYYWTARASDGSSLSAWSTVASFIVDTVNEPPTAPVPLSPIGGATVTTLQPALVVQNAQDPDSHPLSYVFQIDTVPSFNSPDLQVSPAVAETPSQTAWPVAVPLRENTGYYWRVAANDGFSTGPWSATASFFVSATNEAPGTPVLLDPVDGRVVTTAAPTLCLRNTSDPDHDPLTYAFKVTNAGGTVVASTQGVASNPSGTTCWTVPAPLAEDQVFQWTARAFDGQLNGAWAAPATFAVNAVAEPPTAPGLVAPPESSTVGVRNPALVVSNATSQDGLALSYTFELYAVGTGGSQTLVDSVNGIPQGGGGTTSWTSSVSLADGNYSWRARAVDPFQPGPWMASAHFTVLVDVPPSPPTGLKAVPGDRKVDLSWNANPEPDVVGYRVYRATTSGGPYTPIGAPIAPAFSDTGRTNGVTYYYVVTALDAHFESQPSAEVAATPTAPPTELAAEIRFDPATVAGECLLTVCDPDRSHMPPRSNGGDDEDDCPEWLYATIELPAGVDPATISLSTIRLGGSVAVDASYSKIVDVDHDGIKERRVRFKFRLVVPLLAVGPNALVVTGKAGATPFRGTGVLTVTALRVDLYVTPRTLNRRSTGQDVQAQLTFHGGVFARDVDTASLRLNETVPILRVVSTHDGTLIVKFKRSAVNAILPLGDHVEVRVSGKVKTLPFTSKDYIRVTE
jgi:subtilase family serine protease/Tol biopolymer transport system component/flagellar hook assembly protein FlgD